MHILNTSNACTCNAIHFGFVCCKNSYRTIHIYVHITQKDGNLQFLEKNWVCTPSGVFKGRRARQLPRPFWGPPSGVSRINFSYLWWNIHYSLINCATKQVINKYSTSKGAPLQKMQCAGILHSKGPQTPLKCVSTLLVNFIAGPLNETVVCKYSAFTGAPDSNSNV